MDFDERLVNAISLTDKQFSDFLDEVEKVPAKRSPVQGAGVRMFFEFIEDTALRVNEGIHVRKQDIDFRTRILTVTEPKTESQCKCSRWKNADMYSRRRVLDYADKNCSKCHGKGKWKKPQFTTITPRIEDKLELYCNKFDDNDLLWPIHRITLWKFGKKAGVNAKINIFQKKEERVIEGVFLHLFRAMCSLRVTREAKDDDYQDQLVACKLRHSFQNVTERYTRININYLLNWESKTYDMQP